MTQQTSGPFNRAVLLRRASEEEEEEEEDEERVSVAGEKRPAVNPMNIQRETMSPS